MPVKVPTRVVVHPIVLLSVVDHFNRLGKIGNQRRVVGVLLGRWRANGVVDIATSYAGIVPSPFFLCSTIELLFYCLQFHLMKTKESPVYGSWTTTTLRT